jgi:hypothetical protein
MCKVFSLIIGVLLATTQTHALGADQPCYAFLSLIGDKLDVAIYQRQTGSRIEQNKHVPLPIKDAFFDDVAVSAASRAVSRLVPGAALVRLASSSPTLYENQREIFEEKNSVIALPEAISTALRKEEATHLILITKVRAEASLKMTNRTEGTGTLEGLGFYVDRATYTIQTETGERGLGYLAPFVYMKISLVDAKTMRVIKEQTVKASHTLTAGRDKENAHPWDALTNEQKGRVIEQMIRQEIARVMPELLRVE